MATENNRCVVCRRPDAFELKLKMLCQFREKHEMEFGDFKEKVGKKFEGLNKLMLGNLITLCFLLLAALINIGLHFVK